MGLLGAVSSVIGSINSQVYSGLVDELEDFSEISALIDSNFKKMEAAKANANSNNGADFSSLKEKYKLHSRDEFFSFANKKVKGVNKSKKNKESSRR
ncbi:hypothetical protein NYG95_06220 [Campylobacter felis]|uniref:Uncharacterized protein n=1 Tax=Campylobacter felis TaxID=2974565 RepID=A0ABT7I4H6_9BACT|nr:MULTISPECIES: hypothetical protein [Campylobacter]MDL0103802.1 hypothetical protein [Campylobacter felis]MDL0108621.1 hypothetical protein [Campylobacter felis]MDL0109447.1 hypothetical protein [Campylobacter felis]MDL0147202.1 hypothetical protein [Campylobacter felis]